MKHKNNLQIKYLHVSSNGLVLKISVIRIEVAKYNKKYKISDYTIFV